MVRILKIEGVMSWKSKGKLHHRTYVVLDDGEEAVGYGKDFQVNNKVERFFHKGQIKVRLPARKKDA